MERSWRGRSLVLGFLSGLLVTGCTGPSLRDSIREARDLTTRRRLSEAIEKYASATSDAAIAEATDPETLQSRGEIWLDLYRLEAPAVVAGMDADSRERLRRMVPALRDTTGSDLLSAAMRDLTRVIATTVDGEQHAACSVNLAQILRLKLGRPELRRVRPTDAFDELLYRRLMQESVSDYELFALVRRPAEQARSGEAAASALDALSRDLHALAEFPSALPPAVSYWKARAAGVGALARDTRTKPTQVRLDPQVRAMVESDIETHLKLATAAHDLAVRHNTADDDDAMILEAYEDMLRHAFFAQEASAEPTARERDVLNAAKVGLEQLRGHALK
ncbi:MAG: hypothetical protein HYY16_08360 [Planctomycetes bacterium]|nr:hypothetical protein [Planctomycetota bacterium]